MIRLTITLLLLGLVLNTGFSQSSDLKLISSGGNSFSSSNFSLSYSIGESVITTKQNSNLLITQGFNQYLFNTLPTDVVYSTIENLHIQVFPNPVVDFVNVVFDTRIVNHLNIKIYSIDGSLLYQKDNIEMNIKVDLTKCSSDFCTLIVTDSTDTIVKTAKLKINH